MVTLRDRWYAAMEAFKLGSSRAPAPELDATPEIPVEEDARGLIELRPLADGRERSVFRVSHREKCICQYCGTGGNTFEAVFSDAGRCGACGAEGGKYDVIKLVDEFPDIEKSIFVVFADDTKESAGSFIDRLREKGAHIVTLEDLMPNGVLTEQVPLVLERATDKVASIMIFPSKQLNGKDERRDDLILDVAFTQRLRGKRKPIIPIYVDETHVKYLERLALGATHGYFMDNTDIKQIGFGIDSFYDFHADKFIKSANGEAVSE